MNEQQRIGKFAIPAREVRFWWEHFEDLMRGKVVVNVQYRFIQDDLLYTAYCRDFEPVDVNCEPLGYGLVRLFQMDTRGTGERYAMGFRLERSDGMHSREVMLRDKHEPVLQEESDSNEAHNLVLACSTQAPATNLT